MKDIKKKITINYDQGSDILYITFGKPRPGVAEEANDGILIRTDKTDLLGLTIIGLKERFLQK